MAQTRLERARKRLSSQDIDGARRECAAILKDAAATTSDISSAHLVLASCWQRGGDNETALKHVRSAVGLTPDDPIARYAFAELLEADGDKAGAIDSLQHAVLHKPDF